MKKIFAVAITILFQGCSIFGVNTVETLKYTVVEEQGNFTIRQYEDYWVARTTVQGNYSQSSDKGFNQLFGYISGQNSRQEKIAMTAPVVQREQGEKISMTSPVLQQKVPDGWTMEFVLPARFNHDTPPPQPLNPQVTVIKVQGYKAAALRYSGNLSEKKFEQKTNELLTLIKQEGLEIAGEPFSAGYNPPWTIPFLKHNEVMIELK